MKAFLIGIIAFVVIAAGLALYLAPDDLRDCKEVGSNAGCEQADAIVAVSGGDTIARTREAIALYKKGWANKLIFSGAAQDKSGPSNAEVMRQEARNAGISDTVIITEEYSETTKQNAEKTQSIFERNNIHSVILVTSAYHQRRAGLEFEKRSANVKVRNHPVANDNQWSGWWWATPVGWYLAVSEFMKVMLFYVGGTR